MLLEQRGGGVLFAAVAPALVRTLRCATADPLAAGRDKSDTRVLRSTGCTIGPTRHATTCLPQHHSMVAAHTKYPLNFTLCMQSTDNHKLRS